MRAAASRPFRAGGHAYGTDVYLGGAQYVSSGGVDSATSYVAGQEWVREGGVASYDTVASGGALDDDGVTSHTTVAKGGIEGVFPGGYDYYSLIYGNEIVYESTAVAYYATVEAGGAQSIVVGGLAYDTTVLHGGFQSVYSGGVADYTQDYGVETIASGGKAYGDLVRSGGVVYVSSGGADSASSIYAGGAEIVSAGGVVSGAKVALGVLTVSSGGAVSAGLTIAAAWRDLRRCGGRADSAVPPGAIWRSITPASTPDPRLHHQRRFDLGGYTYNSGETVKFTEAATCSAAPWWSMTGSSRDANLTLTGHYSSSTSHCPTMGMAAPM